MDENSGSSQQSSDGTGKRWSLIAQSGLAALRSWGGWASIGSLALLAVLAARLPIKQFPMLGYALSFAGLMVLILALVSAIACESDPAGLTRATVQRWGAVTTVIILVIAIASKDIFNWAMSASNSMARITAILPQTILSAMALLMLLLGWWFMKVFTTQPGEYPPKEETLLPMVRFCYVFTLLILAFSVVIPPIFTMFPENVYNKLARGPLSIVKGCVHTDDVKWELACSKDDPYKLEWFINIGGSARLTHTTDPKLVPKDPVDSWIDPTPHRPMIVHGGLVVPWYFVALALIGGAVSLARKIPEYQRKALDKSEVEFTAQRTRELMEFQILQLISAPLIAIAAYNLITPDSLQATTALGFITGFSSETVLLGIRAVVDRLCGIMPKQQPEGVAGTNPPPVPAPAAAPPPAGMPGPVAAAH